MDSDSIDFRRPKPRVFLWLALVCAAVVVAGAAEAQKKNPLGFTAEGPIQVTADELVADNRSRTAEFVGNVEAVQGEVVIRSKRLKIVYAGAGKSEREDIEGKIDTITASGDVRIRFGDRTAEAESAEYRTAEGVLILSGEGSRIVEGDNSITGSRITLYRDDERIKVEGGEQKRVKAVFTPSSAPKE